MARSGVAVGQFVPVATSSFRPDGVAELSAYGIRSRLRGKRVLDIGTGDGRLALGAAALGAREVVAVDPDPVALRAARAVARRAGLRARFEAGAAQELPVGDRRFDIAILSWTL